MIAGLQSKPENPVYIIAEAGVNHNGDMGIAAELIAAAAESGADAVKFQSFTASKIVTEAAPKADYQIRNTKAEGSQLEMLRALELTADAHHSLREACRKAGIEFLSSPFDVDNVRFLGEFGVSAIKIPSGEIRNTPYLHAIGQLHLPVILSTGMSNIAEVALAVDTLRASGCEHLNLLHCVSNYPTAPSDVNLRAMHTMRAAFGVPVGFSDHTQGTSITFAAIALGAEIIEKHFTLDRSMPGPDHAASVEPQELSDLVQGMRDVHASLGDGIKRLRDSEANTLAVARKSLVWARDLPHGTTVTEQDLAVKRPGTGISPDRMNEVLGRTVAEEVREDELVTADHFRPAGISDR